MGYRAIIGIFLCKINDMMADDHPYIVTAAIGRPVYTDGQGCSSPSHQADGDESKPTERTCMKIQTSNDSVRSAPTINYVRAFIGPSKRPNGKMPLLGARGSRKPTARRPMQLRCTGAQFVDYLRQRVTS
jgi:hypothetical protein